ncbi:MAG: Uma2 family endonuclease [Waterburya sp.]
MITITSTDNWPLLLNVSNTTLHVTPEEFDSLCIDNPDLRLELTKDKELIVMPPTGGESGERNGELFGQVWNWNKKTKLGRAFDSSTGYDFVPIGGGKMSPDVSWIEKSRLEGINIEKFIPVVPDFVIELRSATDRLKKLQEKMLEYQRLEVKLGLLINPQDKQVEIYQLGRNTEILNSPITVNCDWLMPKFNLDLTEIFDK